MAIKYRASFAEYLDKEIDDLLDIKYKKRSLADYEKTRLDTLLEVRQELQQLNNKGD